jgi:AraC family transcriptional regulator
MVLIAPGTSDRLHWQGVSERLIVSIRPEWLADYAVKLDAKRPVQFETRWDFRDASVGYLLAEMGREAEQAGPLGQLYADLLAMGVGSLLLRRYAADAIAAPMAKGGLSLNQLRRVMEFMDEHLAEDLRLEQIARELNLSAFHFAHEFRNSTGTTPYQYLLNQRMERAKGLLQSTAFSVQSIGELAGFRSPVNFVRAFRERIGITPAQWRKSV